MSTIERIWTDVIRPSEPTLAPEVASHFLFIDLTEEENSRYLSLSTKDPATLTEEETYELNQCRHIVAFLTYMRTKSRESLQDQLGLTQ